MPVSPKEFDDFVGRINDTLRKVESIIDNQLLVGNHTDIRIEADLVPMKIRLQVFSEQFWSTLKKRYEDAGWREFTYTPVMSVDPGYYRVSLSR